MSFRFVLIDKAKARGWGHGPFFSFIADIPSKRDNERERQTARSFADDFGCIPMLRRGRLRIRKVKIVAKTNVVLRANVFVSRPNHGEYYENFLLPRYRRRLVVKDNIATSQGWTTAASGLLRQHKSPFEATVVGRLRYGRRATVVGKTNLDEFGMGSHSTHSYFGPVRNVLGDRNRSVGGSSGGSAVAIAGGQADIALGTDTGGSVRLPAAYTGIVGFKPSYGLVSRRGVIPYANSLDTVGVLALDVPQIRGTFQILSKHDPRDPTSITPNTRKRFKQEQRYSFTKRKIDPEQDPTHPASGSSNPPLANVRIGVPVEYNIAELSEEVRTAWKTTLRLLEKGGAKIIPISLPNTKHALSAYYIIAPAEAASNLSKYDGVRYGSRSAASDGAGDVLYSRTRGEGFGDEVKRRILLGSYTLSSEAIDNYFIKAQKIRRLVQQDFDRVFSTPNLLRPCEQFNLSDMDESVPLENKLGPSQVDFIVCPTAPTIPPLLQEVSKQTSVDTYMNDIFTVPASLAGLPAISIPCSLPDRDQIDSNFGPVGMQIIGQFADDFGVLGMASILEKLLGEPSGIVRLITPKPTSKSVFSSKGNPLRITKFVSIKGDEPLRIKKFVSGERDEPLRITKFESRKGDQPLRIKNFVSSERDEPPKPDKEDEPLTIRQVQVTGQVRTTNIASDKGARNRTTDKEIEKELENSLESWEWIISPPGRSDLPHEPQRV